MERIDQLLNRLLGKKGFQQHYEQMKRRILSHPEIQAFLREHEQEITKEMVDRSLMKLHEFMEQSKNCGQCPSLDQCKNFLKGYHPRLVIKGTAIDVEYERCPAKVKYDERKRQESLIQSLFVPREILQASLSDIDLADEGRMKAIELADRFVSEYEPGKDRKSVV